MSWELLRNIGLSIAKGLCTATAIGIVVNYFIIRWRHHFARIAKITDLQDEVYREARNTLTSMIHAFDPVILGLQTTAAADKSTEDVLGAFGIGESVPDALKQNIENRIGMANIAMDIERLFSPKVHVAFADAFMSVSKYYSELTLFLTGYPSDDSDATSRFYTSRGEAVFKVRSALQLLSQEIGVDPRRRWWHRFRKTPEFGRRASDIPDKFYDIEWQPPVDSKGRNRRYADKLWRNIASRGRRGEN